MNCAFKLFSKTGMDPAEKERIIIDFLGKMKDAIMLDEEARDSGQPATHKLALLPQVMENLIKSFSECK